MAPIRQLVAILLPIIVLTIGCGGNEETTESRAGIPEKATTTSAQESPGRQAIPPEMPDAVEGLSIAPFFDEAGTVTELAVAPGELFNVYIVVAHPGYEMSSAQWRMTIPDGVTMLGETRLFEHSLSIGDYDNIFAVTYPCQTSSEPYAVIKYNCMVTPEFQGGTIETVKAVSMHEEKDPPFIGFATCGVERDMVPAHGGTATLTSK
jgi:hypothetical protein